VMSDNLLLRVDLPPPALPNTATFFTATLLLALPKLIAYKPHS
jgi:hypothetical protein